MEDYMLLATDIFCENLAVILLQELVNMVQRDRGY
jgi:hypothetical protein